VIGSSSASCYQASIDVVDPRRPPRRLLSRRPQRGSSGRCPQGSSEIPTACHLNANNSTERAIGRTDDGMVQHVVDDILRPCLLTSTSKKSHVGCEPTAQRSPPRASGISRRSWAIARSFGCVGWLRVFTSSPSLAQCPTVTVAGLEQFSNDAIDYAISRKGQFSGLQNGVAVIPVLVGERIEPDAATFATDTLGRRFSAFAWPATVDLTSPRVYQHEGQVLLGGIYADWMRQQTAIALPDPSRHRHSVKTSHLELPQLAQTARFCVAEADG
jgi:hypothetical protein